VTALFIIGSLSLIFYFRAEDRKDFFTKTKNAGLVFQSSTSVREAASKKIS
jgi:hypothetical protein